GMEKVHTCGARDGAAGHRYSLARGTDLARQGDQRHGHDAARGYGDDRGAAVARMMTEVSVPTPMHTSTHPAAASSPARMDSEARGAQTGDCPAVLRLRLLGQPLMWRDEQPVRFKMRKTLAALAYLAAEGGPRSREHLATLLWPTHDLAGARKNLRT